MTDAEVEAKLAELGLSGNKLTEAAEAMQAAVDAGMAAFTKTPTIDNLADFFQSLHDQGVAAGAIMGIAGTIALLTVTTTAKALNLSGEEQIRVLSGIWENLGEQLVKVMTNGADLG